MKKFFASLALLLGLAISMASLKSCGIFHPGGDSRYSVCGLIVNDFPVDKYMLTGDSIKLRWSTTSGYLNPGYGWIQYEFISLYGSPQFITILEIDPKRYSFKIMDHMGLKRTSEVASEAEAEAAINGTFYNMKQGGSVCYLQIDGTVVDTTKGSNMQLRTNGAVVIRKGKLSIEPWNQEKEKAFRNNKKRRGSVMASMPLLIQDGHKVELLENKGFSDKRHPRSVIFEKDGNICLMVIDGRSKGNAAGMTLDEVQRYLLSMDGGKGCDNAINLDGGGSSTLWEELYGVLNHPSDNGKFDNKGERRVANSIIILNK